MNQSLLELKNVSKSYLYWEDRPKSIKSMLADACRGHFKFGNRRLISVLNDVSFNVNHGDFIGIMGRNGAGKSTLMKVMCGIYAPTSGTVVSKGRIAPLLELGAGFVGELSGYENIFLNSAILGYSRSQVLKDLSKIIEFSGLEDRIYMPVKNYSSGMLMRLGFSVAVHLDSPIVLFDEVMAVGDIGFQEKCYYKILEMHKSGRAIILVTHSPEYVVQFCNRCLILNEGKVVFNGSPSEGAKIYQNLFHPGQNKVTS